jgi:hypothetical protein
MIPVNLHPLRFLNSHSKLKKIETTNLHDISKGRCGLVLQNLREEK